MKRSAKDFLIPFAALGKRNASNLRLRAEKNRTYYLIQLLIYYITYN